MEKAKNLIDLSYRQPLVGHLEITHKCPFNCEFCYNSSTGMQELNTEEIKNIIDQIAQEGCVYLNISGGEPLMHKDFLEIFLYAKRVGMHVSVESNLYFIPDGFIETIQQYPIDNFNISIYGINSTTFQKITRSKANYKNVVNNIDLLLKSKIDFMLRTPVSKDVLPSLGELSDFCEAIGVGYKIDPKIFWKQNGKRIDRLRVNSNEVEKYVDSHHIYNLLYSLLNDIYKESFTVKTCRWGINEFYINPYGQMHYCIVYWSTKFNLREKSFSEIWHNIIANMRKLEKNYCVGKVAARTGNECPSGKFYHDSNIDLSLSIRERLKINNMDLSSNGELISHTKIK